MGFGFSYRETSFSPAETASITGVALHLQRDWRSQGLLRARDSGRAAFTPRELAEMRVMVKLRSLGVSLAVAKPLSEEAAPAVLYAAIANIPGRALAVDGPPEAAAKFMDAIDRQSDGDYLHQLAGSSAASTHRFAVVIGASCVFVPTLGEGEMLNHVEVGGLINLWAVAEAIVGAAERPLFTLVMPKNV